MFFACKLQLINWLLLKTLIVIIISRLVIVNARDMYTYKDIINDKYPEGMYGGFSDLLKSN